MPINFKGVPKQGGDHAPAHPDTSAPEPHPAEKFTITDFAQNHLKFHLHKSLSGPTTPRAHNVVHASDLDPQRDWCPREPALLTLSGKKRPGGFVSTSQKVTWNMGYMGADMVIDAIPDNMIWGDWKCRACNHVVKGEYRPGKCHNCGKAKKKYNWRYQEVFMRDAVSEVVGSCDAWVDLLGNGKLKLVEMKTEGAEGFKARNKATLEHEWRSKLYLKIAAGCSWMPHDKLDLTEARILYICKSGYAKDPDIKKWKVADWGMSPFKEYVTKRDDDAVEARFDLAMEYRNWYNNYKGPTLVPLPDRIPSCSGLTCTRAKTCPVKKNCWAL